MISRFDIPQTVIDCIEYGMATGLIDLKDIVALGSEHESPNTIPDALTFIAFQNRHTSSGRLTHKGMCDLMDAHFVAAQEEPSHV
jgi:hypothetical protein